MSVENTLKDRESKYGSFKDMAEIYDRLSDAFAGVNLTAAQGVAIDMICVKLARIATGDPSLVDNWHDIAGYATLVEKEITQHMIDTNFTKVN